MAGTIDLNGEESSFVAGVSMESGLDGRNNRIGRMRDLFQCRRLNGVRPRWPEQSGVRRRILLRAIESQWSPA